MLHDIQSGLRDLDGEDIASCLDVFDLLDEDSLEDMVADIKTDTQCLIDLDSMYEYPVNDLKSHPPDQREATSTFQDWREKFVDFLYQKFPLAHQDLIQQLGWFLNGRLDMRQREYNPSSKITLQSLIEEDIYDTLSLYFDIWKLHNDINSSCPLCCESVGNIQEFFEMHLSEHAEEIYLLAYHPGLDKTNEKTYTDSNVTESKSTKLLSKDFSQSDKGNKASANTKQDLILYDSTSKEEKDEHLPTSTPIVSWPISKPIKKTSTIAKSTTDTRSPRLLCHLCNYYPKGFRGQYELRRHIDIAHVTRKVWVCVDISPDKSFLANCKQCRNGKKYTASYNAAAHLRRIHFNRQHSDHGGQGKASDSTHRGGMGGGNFPPMEVLKHWMEEREESVDAGTDTGQGEGPPSTASSDYSPSVGEESDGVVEGEDSMKTRAAIDELASLPKKAPNVSNVTSRIT